MMTHQTPTDPVETPMTIRDWLDKPGTEIGDWRSSRPLQDGEDAALTHYASTGNPWMKITVRDDGTCLMEAQFLRVGLPLDTPATEMAEWADTILGAVWSAMRSLNRTPAFLAPEHRAVPVLLRKARKSANKEASDGPQESD